MIKKYIYGSREQRQEFLEQYEPVGKKKLALQELNKQRRSLLEQIESAKQDFPAAGIEVQFNEPVHPGLARQFCDEIHSLVTSRLSFACDIKEVKVSGIHVDYGLDAVTTALKPRKPIFDLDGTSKR